MDDGGLVTPGDVVVTTTMDASPDECRAVTEKGALVVVLTPHHTCSEASKYFAAGAAHYVEMTASVSALTVAVQAAMRKGQALALGAG